MPEREVSVGDVYTWQNDDPGTIAHWVSIYGEGPFVFLHVEFPARHRVKNITTGAEFGPWAGPDYWGRFDPFLTAAYHANNT